MYTTVAFNALNFNLGDEGLSPFKTIKDFIYMALAAVNNDSGASSTQISALMSELDSEKSKTADGALGISFSD